jgi:16S rRNA (adenine1518-N6/adenine1519-N6)-dimethyltransferase
MSDITRIRAKKSLGQNFLIDEEALADIASSVVVDNKHIIEVGPGYGALTDYLIASNPVSLTLVELDTDMIRILEEKYHSPIMILHEDVLQFTPRVEQYSVIANIPYYITSPILFHFLYASEFTSPEEMVIMMQEEVGEKILE